MTPSAILYLYRGGSVPIHQQLNIFHDYCLAWKLNVNIDKTKIVCFTNGRLPQNLQFTS
jgi:hypothetical protein